MKKVIITGATGMIGMALIQYCIQRNIEVLAIIRKNSKRKSNLDIFNKKIKILECDLNNYCKLDYNEKDFDTFFHLAWNGTLNYEREDNSKQEVNIGYTIDAVHLAKRLGCNLFIGVGSQAEYGNIEGIISEKTEEIPNTPYGIAKMKSGYESRKIAQELGIRHIWTRVFSVYGPYDSDNTMILKSIQSFFNGESLDYTLGEQNWDYIYSFDVAKALYLLGEYGKNNEIYCIASGKTQKLSKYIKIIKDEINPNIELKLGLIPYKKNQVMNLTVNIDKIKKDTGFVPEIEFQEGIKKTIHWYMNIE